MVSTGRAGGVTSPLVGGRAAGYGRCMPSRGVEAGAARRAPLAPPWAARVAVAALRARRAAGRRVRAAHRGVRLRRPTWLVAGGLAAAVAVRGGPAGAGRRRGPPPRATARRRRLSAAPGVLLTGKQLPRRVPENLQALNRDIRAWT